MVKVKLSLYQAVKVYGGVAVCSVPVHIFIYIGRYEKSTAISIMSVCPSARNKSVPTARILVMFYIGDLQRNLFVTWRGITHLRQGTHKYFYDNISEKFFLKS